MHDPSGACLTLIFVEFSNLISESGSLNSGQLASSCYLDEFCIMGPQNHEK